MTIIQPNKYASRGWRFVVPLMLVLFTGGYAVVSLYTSTVDLRHQFTTQEKEFQQLTVANAELKNRLYALIDPGDAAARAAALGLVLEHRPTYVEITPEPVAMKP